MSTSRRALRKIATGLIGIFVLIAAGGAQELPVAKPETVGLSSERLQRIETAVQRNIDDKRIAGAVTKRFQD